MAEVNAVNILLKHIGPSMRVTGQTTALPAGDRVGTLLSHLTPSMAARLDREGIRQPHASRAMPHTGPPTPAEISHRGLTCPRTPAVCCAVAPAARGAYGPAFRARPIHPADAGAPSRPPGGPASPEPPATSPTPGPSGLDWPWTRPLPPPASPPPATACPYPPRQAPVVGEMLDLFA